MGLISWLIAGLLVGTVANFLRRSEFSKGFLKTAAVAVTGAIVLAGISSFVGFGRIDTFDLGSLLVAFLGALAMLGFAAIFDRKP